MKKILVPTDFSGQADNALQVAIYFARKMDAEIHLLHVEEYVGNTGFNTVGDVSTSNMDQLFVLKLLEVNKRKMLDLIESLDEGLKIHHDVKIGQMFRLVRDYIEENQIDLVVMGTHGASGFSGVMIGSNTEKVVRQATCPVLSVRQLPEAFEIRKIVFATNFDGNQQKAVAQLKQMQSLFGARLHLLYVNTVFSFASSRTVRQRMEDFAAKHTLADYDFHSYNDETEERGIINFADEADADLIAVATHGRTGFAHLLLGSIAEDVVNHAQRPVLTFHLE